MANVVFPHSCLTIGIQATKEGSITVRRLPEIGFDFPGDKIPAGNLVQIECTDGLAGSPVLMKIDYCLESLPAVIDEETMQIWRHNPVAGVWELLSGGVDTVNGVVWAEADGFSLFGIFGDAVFRYGDVNMNGAVDVGDAIMVLRHIVGLSVLGESSLARAKVAGNDELTVADAIMILRYIVDGQPNYILAAEDGQVMIKPAEQHI